MSVGSEVSGSKKKRRMYIPGLAAMEFRPDPDWSVSEARNMYSSRIPKIAGFDVNRVYFEDCIDGMKRLPKESIDLVIADPPFGIEFTGTTSVYNRAAELVVEGYHEIDSEYSSFTEEWISELPRVMKNDATVYVFSGWNNLEFVLAAARNNGLELVNHLIWHYQFGVFTRTKFVTSHYHVLMFVKDPSDYYYHKIEHYPLDVWIIPRKYRRGQKKNGTVLPRAVVQRCMDFSSEPGDLVLDPFMGNGTTAVVAKANFRHFIGFEINSNLSEIITERLNRTKVGESYTPYASRLPTPEELREKYPRAYKVYMARRKERGLQSESTH